jgi:hypothetical protein
MLLQLLGRVPLLLKEKQLAVPLLKRRLRMRNLWKRILDQWLQVPRV